MRIATLYGIPIPRIKELIDLFKEHGHDMNTEANFKILKRQYFARI